MDPTLDVGTGAEAFTAIESGDTLPTSWGRQGGRHVWIALRTHGLDPGKGGLITPEPGPTFELLLVNEEQEELASGSSWIPFDGDLEQAELAGIELRLNWTEQDQLPPALLTVTGEDACGTQVEQQLELGVSF